MEPTDPVVALLKEAAVFSLAGIIVLEFVLQTRMLSAGEALLDVSRRAISAVSADHFSDQRKERLMGLYARVLFSRALRFLVLIAAAGCVFFAVLAGSRLALGERSDLFSLDAGVAGLVGLVAGPVLYWVFLRKAVP